MKKIFYFLITLQFIFSANSQENKEALSSKFRPGVMWFYTGLRPAIPEKVRKYDRLIIDITYNDWFGKKNKILKNNWGSIGVNSNIMVDIPLTKGNTCSFGIGLSYSLFKINHNNLLLRNDISKSTSFSKGIKNYGINKSIFKLHSVSLPLELRFRGKNWKHFKLHFGGKVTYNFLANTIVSSKTNSLISKYSEYGFYDLNPINFSAYLRFGIRNWAFFSQYNFLPLFNNSSSVQLNTYQFGISISLF